MKKIFAVLACLAAAISSFAATGTVSFVYQDIFPVHQVIASWTTGTGGTNASGTMIAIAGTLDRVVFVPSSTALYVPDAYTVTLKDEQGIDLFSGKASALTSNVAVNAIYTHASLGTGTNSFPWTFAGPLTMLVTNDVAGMSTRKGTVYIYYRVGP